MRGPRSGRMPQRTAALWWLRTAWSPNETTAARKRPSVVRCGWPTAYTPQWTQCRRPERSRRPISRSRRPSPISSLRVITSCCRAPTARIRWSKECSSNFRTILEGKSDERPVRPPISAPRKGGPNRRAARCVHRAGCAPLHRRRPRGLRPRRGRVWRRRLKRLRRRRWRERRRRTVRRWRSRRRRRRQGRRRGRSAWPRGRRRRRRGRGRRWRRGRRRRSDHQAGMVGSLTVR
jgi:hypothetical protein